MVAGYELLSRINVPVLLRHHFGSSWTSHSVMQTWWQCGHQTQSLAKHFIIMLICLYTLRLAEAFWKSTATPVQQMCLLMGWERAKPEACDVTVTSSLTSGDACKSAGVAAYTAVLECSSSDSKCQELGWVCIPFAVEM